MVTNDWLFDSLGDDELFEDGYFFNLSSGDIIEVNLGSSLGTAEHTLEYESRGGSLSGGSELKHVNSATNFSHLKPIPECHLWLMIDILCLHLNSIA